MPIKGVSEKEEQIIKEILSAYKKYNFYYYGSRVKGNFRGASDLDIYIKSSNNIDLNDIEDMKKEFDESLLPYVVNLAYDADDKFYKMIEKDFVNVFE